MPIGYNRDDTIVALATAAGSAPLAVIRLSGKKAFTAIDTIFFSKKKVSEAETHTILFGKIIHLSVVVDEVLVSVFKNPTSFTGEDVVEISCHGGSVVSQEIISILLSLGSSYALPGEFTYRAFLNGKIDLSQAESISDLINANNSISKKRALQGLLGEIGNKIASLRSDLLNMLSLIELALDFSEEGISIVSQTTIKSKLELIIADINSIISSYSTSKIYRDGVKVVITGKTNVGKSSLLNALLQESRAIVSDIHGTTRDTIEESVNIKGIIFTFVDTAGIRDTDDVLELEGISRSIKHKKSSDIIIHMYDVYDKIDASDSSFPTINNGNTDIVVINKIDLLTAQVLGFPHTAICLSCKTLEGINKLTDTLYNTVSSKIDLSESSIVVQSKRQIELFNNCNIHLNNSLTSLIENKPNELIAIDIRIAITSLGEIIGETTNDDILNNIFGSFCIGK